MQTLEKIRLKKILLKSVKHPRKPTNLYMINMRKCSHFFLQIPFLNHPSGQILTFHQPRFPWNVQGFPFLNGTFSVEKSCEVRIIWPESMMGIFCFPLPPVTTALFRPPRTLCGSFHCCAKGDSATPEFLGIHLLEEVKWRSPRSLGTTRTTTTCEILCGEVVAWHLFFQIHGGVYSFWMMFFEPLYSLKQMMLHKAVKCWKMAKWYLREKKQQPESTAYSKWMCIVPKGERTTATINSNRTAATQPWHDMNHESLVKPRSLAKGLTFSRLHLNPC